MVLFSVRESGLKSQKTFLFCSVDVTVCYRKVAHIENIFLQNLQFFSLVHKTLFHIF